MTTQPGSQPAADLDPERALQQGRQILLYLLVQLRQQGQPAVGATAIEHSSTAHRLRSIVNRIQRAAIALEWADLLPVTTGLQTLLTPIATQAVHLDQRIAALVSKGVKCLEALLVQHLTNRDCAQEAAMFAKVLQLLQRLRQQLATELSQSPSERSPANNAAAHDAVDMSPEAELPAALANPWGDELPFPELRQIARSAPKPPTSDPPTSESQAAPLQAHTLTPIPDNPDQDHDEAAAAQILTGPTQRRSDLPLGLGQADKLTQIVRQGLEQPVYPTPGLSQLHVLELGQQVRQLLEQANTQAVQGAEHQQHLQQVRRIGQRLQRRLIQAQLDLDRCKVPDSERQQFERQQFERQQPEQLQKTRLEQVERSLQDVSQNLAQLVQNLDVLTQSHQQHQTTQRHQQRLVNRVTRQLADSQTTTLAATLAPLQRLWPQIQSLYPEPVELRIESQIEGQPVAVDHALSRDLYKLALQVCWYLLAVEPQPKPDAADTTQATQRSVLSQVQSANRITISAVQAGQQLILRVQGQGPALHQPKPLPPTAAPVDPLRSASGDPASNPALNPDLTPTALTELLFEPEFSAATDPVPTAAPRGSRELAAIDQRLLALRGTLTVQANAHAGTTLSLQIPSQQRLEMVLICAAAEQVYALRTTRVQRLIVPAAQQLRQTPQGLVLLYTQPSATTLLPIHDLGELLRPLYGSGKTAATPAQPIAQPPLGRPLLILCDRQNQQYALAVDRVLGKQTTVVRSLPAMTKTPSYLVGTTPLTVKRLALVIDACELIAQLKT
ncbi:MAG: chemotaxis protein CheW [Cyanobacteria bacterium P01_H01_bin.121]